MRTVMREDTHKEKEKQKILSERKEKGFYLIEKWAKEAELGEGLIDLAEKDERRALNLAFVIENQERHLQTLTETQISSVFSTTPENVLRVVRLGYGNSVRGEIFFEFGMETARDSVYYLKPIYDSTKRGATSQGVTYESAAFRFASEIEEDTIGTGDGSTLVYTGTLSNVPVRPYSVKIISDNKFVGTDNGAGVLTGATLSGTNTINYTAGNVTITFSGGNAPATGIAVVVQYNYDSEVAANYTDLGQIELVLTDYQFRARAWPLGVAWSKMTEVLLSTTLKIDVEEALIRGASDELKKSLDFQACRMGYQTSRSNTLTTFNANFAVAGADSEMAHAQSITRYIDNAADTIYSVLQRGGVTQIYGGPLAVNYLKLHNRFSDQGKQPHIGVYKVGQLDGIGIYKTPSTIVPTDELVLVYRNEQVPEDVAIAFGTLVPLYATDKLTFKNLYSEIGLAHFGDAKTLQSAYIVRMKLSNLA